MKKLKLQMEALAVESFTTSQAGPPRGTVEAHNTFRGNTCGAENSCGPQTCPPLYCSFGTDPMACGDTLNCPTPACPQTGACATGGGFTCVGCTTQDYTVNLADDTCGACQSFGSDVPARCPCP